MAVHTLGDFKCSETEGYGCHSVKFFPKWVIDINHILMFLREGALQEGIS